MVLQEMRPGNARNNGEENRETEIKRRPRRGRRLDNSDIFTHPR